MTEKVLSDAENLRLLRETADSLEATAASLEKTNEKLRLSVDAMEKSIDRLISRHKNKNPKEP